EAILCVTEQPVVHDQNATVGPVRTRAHGIHVRGRFGETVRDWLTLASQDPNIELKKLIGKPVTITLQLTDALASTEERYFHGYITDFEHIGTDGGLARYKAIARPWITFMDRRQDIRIFQEQTVGEPPLDQAAETVVQHRCAQLSSANSAGVHQL
ncbi:phage late control D family protein, partial [Burkholderia pseudomultivorans]|uniref:phage late control D family protein n=1 Tax=Burkholderia pseudomultivorans TaxID=1207504 RepID=UPI00287B67A6